MLATNRGGESSPPPPGQPVDAEASGPVGQATAIIFLSFLIAHASSSSTMTVRT